jgi:hypothetical protein
MWHIACRLEATRHFGPHLEALITYLHYECHFNFKRLRQLLEQIFGTLLSAVGEVSILERAGSAAPPEKGSFRSDWAHKLMPLWRPSSIPPTKASNPELTESLTKCHWALADVVRCSSA